MRTKMDKKRSGQLLILSVVMLGGILMSATAVAGLLLRYQLRLTNDVADSAKALFAADGRLEWHNFCAEKNINVIRNAPNPGAISLDCISVSPEPLFDDARVTATSTIEFTDNPLTSTRDGRIFSEGFSGKSTRAVETILPF